jgi:glycosyltransferase involved in cell wall biosynthesis
MRKNKILLIYTDWGTNDYRLKTGDFGAIGYYRIIKPAQYLKDYFDVEVVGKNLDKFGLTAEQVWQTVFNEFDLIITKYSDNPNALVPLLFFADYYKKPLIIDIDDNIYDVLPSNPNYQEFIGEKGIVIKTSYSLATGLFVSTYPLKEKTEKHLKEVHEIKKDIFVLPNCNDYLDWLYPAEKHNKKIIIGYSGSITHDEDLEIIVPVINKIFEKYPNVRFYLLGSVRKERQDEFRAKFGKYAYRVKIKLGVPAFRFYPLFLAEQNFDIGLAPLVDNEFNRCKSHIKWMEYSMYQIPMVASRVYPYCEPIDGIKTIQDGKTGFLAGDEKEWVEKLSFLIENKQKRLEIGQNAYDYIKYNWQYRDNIKKWVKAIKHFLS